MAIPPSYSDFSKDINDLFNKDYPLGASKLEVNSTTTNGFKVTVNNVKDNVSGKITSDLKTKYTDRENGFVFTNTWHAGNALTAQLELQDLISTGFKLDLHGAMHPALGTTAAKAGIELKQQNVFARSSVDLLAKNGATVHTDVVVGSEGLLLAGDVAYNTADATIHRYNVAVGYKTPEYSLAFHATKKFTHFTAGYFHNINRGLQVASRATWDQTTANQVGIEVGTKYALDNATFVKAKIDNYGRLGLGYTQQVQPSIKLQLGGSFDTTRLSENVHKIGFAFIVDA
ncbi:Mitochondrial porin [Rhizoclosmatium sp. JEL0117]|nr:Mitochondrial porin [Rhizoclosmatium sp. JEL0117]